MRESPQKKPAVGIRLPTLDRVRRIHDKPALHRFYREVYSKYEACIARAPQQGIILELGSGFGFAKEVIPGLVTSDISHYPGLDRVVDATKMPFESGSIRVICMWNVFHHIHDVGLFLAEAERCLMPGGRLLIIDHYFGWLSTPIYKHLHHETFNDSTLDWSFDSADPVESANVALAWIVFHRDVEKFRARFPLLRVDRTEPHSPLRYWLCGGLRSWSLLPGWAFGLATWLDRALCRISPRLASFTDIEVVRN